MGFTAEEIAEKVVGLSLADAEAMCVRNGCISRVTCEDGHDRICTCELYPNRINFSVENGQVVAADVG